MSDEIRAGFTIDIHPHERKPDEVWFFKDSVRGDLMLGIKIGCLSGSFTVKANELAEVKKFLRGFH